MALTASLGSSNVHTVLEPDSGISADPVPLIAAALKYNNLSLDEGFSAFDQVFHCSDILLPALIQLFFLRFVLIYFFQSQVSF
jgi:hypothetical protein